MALAARVLFAFVFTSWHTSDADDYIEQARAILSGGWISNHANGYPLIIAGVERLAGTAHLDAALLSLGIVVSTLLVVLVVILARSIGAAEFHVTLAAFAAALWPNQLQQAQNIGSDIPAAFFLALGVVLLIRGREPFSRAGPGASPAPRRKKAPDPELAAGLALGVGAACRPSLLFAIALLVPVVWRRASRRAACMLMAAALTPLLLVAALSASRGGGFALEGDLGVVLMEADHSYGGAIVVAHEHEVDREEGIAMYFGRLERDPVYFLRQRAAALWELWGSWPYDNGRGLARQIAVAIRFPLLALALVGWYARRANPAAAYMAAPILAITIAQAMLFALVRYTVPLEPLAIALAAAGMSARLPGP